jgi:predicted transcriptional regulator of viral defense system
MRINIIDKLAKKGNVFTINDIVNEFNIQRNVLWVMLSRLEEKGWIKRIEKDKYMIIPLGREKDKYTVNEFLIGSLLVDPYAIAYWSALNHYGLTEQIPNTVFIETTSRKKRQEKRIIGVKYKIVRVKEHKFFGIGKTWIDYDQINITDKEKTIVDCLDKPQYCGGIVEVAKAIKSREYDEDKLVEYTKKINNTGVIRRLGYLCDYLDIDIRLPKINTRNYLYLDPTMTHKGPKNSKWRLIVNLDEKILGDLE